jgi:hypothetical protein
MATDASRKELDGLLNAGRQACGSLQIAGSSNLSAIALTQKLLLVPRLVADWKPPTVGYGGLWKGVNTEERSRMVVARVYPASDPATAARSYVLL